MRALELIGDNAALVVIEGRCFIDRVFRRGEHRAPRIGMQMGAVVALVSVELPIPVELFELQRSRGLEVRKPIGLQLFRETAQAI